MPLPPVIVLGIDTQIGLAVVRELGIRGVPVHGIARSKESVGLHSRRLARGYLRPKDDDSVIALINTIAASEGAPFLMTISETDALLAGRAMAQGRFVNLRALVPEFGQLQIVNDKAATYRVAADVGIPVPRSWHPQSEAEAANPPADLTYPCILKWSNPVEVAAALSAHGLTMRKLEYCHARHELRGALSRYKAVGRYPLVQSYARGQGMGHMLFMHHGDAILRFRHLRISEWPPEGGASTVCRSLPLLPDDPLLEKSVALLRRIGWNGAAMVEYRYDPASGDATLMEINGRFWGSLPLAYHARAPFAWLTYAVLGLGRTDIALPPYRVGLECRSMVPESKRLMRVLFARGAVQDRTLKISRWREVLRFAVGFFNPKTRYYVFEWSDPAPCLADLSGIARKAISRFTRIGGKPRAEPA